jgi:hypothetical protein
MKKRTKKKMKKAAKTIGKGIVKSLIVYPAKGLWKLSKYVVAKRKESKNAESREGQAGRIKQESTYDALQEVRNHQGAIEKFESKLLGNSSTIGIILGARGTGKSAIGMRLLENFKEKTSKKTYALGFKAASLPKWISVVTSINQIQNNSVILIDEGGIEFSSRQAMSNPNKLLSELLLIARHKDLSVLFITQNSSNLEINAIRQADYLILKPSSLLQKDFERKKIKDIYTQVAGEFSELKDTVGLTYIYADKFQGFVTNSLPSFWSEKVSKGYAQR